MQERMAAYSARGVATSKEAELTRMKRFVWLALKVGKAILEVLLKFLPYSEGPCVGCKDTKELRLFSIYMLMLA